MTTMLDLRQWDLIATPSGAAILTIPPCPRPMAIDLADGRDCVLRTAGLAMRLVDSARLVPLLAAARLVVVAEVDEAVRRETVVAVETSGASITEGDDHVRRAA